MASGAQLLDAFRGQQAEINGVVAEATAAREYSKEITSDHDHQSDQTIISVLSKRFPNHNLLTEETGSVDNGSDYTWIVDPIDGSSNFLNHNPYFSISIALARGSEVVLGVVYSPFLEELVVAERGAGATLNGERMSVSSTERLEDTYIVGCAGGEPDNKRFAKVCYSLHAQNKDFRKIGSAAIEGYMVAAGRVDAFTTLSISPWDIAAAGLAVLESGGMVTDMQGRPWTLEKGDLMMSNGVVHESILQRLAVDEALI